jgi:hypothetical protein
LQSHTKSVDIEHEDKQPQSTYDFDEKDVRGNETFSWIQEGGNPIPKGAFRLTLLASHDISDPSALRRVYIGVCPYPLESNWVYLSVSIEGHIRSVLPDRVTGLWVLDTFSSAFNTCGPTPITPVRWSPLDPKLSRALCGGQENAHQSRRRIHDGIDTRSESSLYSSHYYGIDPEETETEGDTGIEDERNDSPWEWWYAWKHLVPRNRIG